MRKGGIVAATKAIMIRCSRKELEIKTLNGFWHDSAQRAPSNMRVVAGIQHATRGLPPYGQHLHCGTKTIEQKKKKKSRSVGSGWSTDVIV